MHRIWVTRAPLIMGTSVAEPLGCVWCRGCLWVKFMDVPVSVIIVVLTLGVVMAENAAATLVLLEMPVERYGRQLWLVASRCG